jgi:uncharacterized membrane protein
MKKTLKVLNAYIHDFASAFWVVTVLIIYWTNSAAFPAGTEEFFFKFKKDFFYIGIGCLAVIVITGAGRTLLYSTGDYGEESEAVRKKILIIKHIIGFIIYGGGTYWQYVMVYG